MTPNNSSTGGYVQNNAPQKLPRSLTFTGFLQTVLIGISGLPGDLVRPYYQRNPPKRPEFDTDWLAFAVTESEAQGFPFEGQTGSGDTLAYTSQYHESCVLECSMYGPAALENYRILRDGFYLSQNLEALVSANFGLIGVGKALRNPELISEQWFNRWTFTIGLRFEQVRTYPVLTLVSASGTIWAPTAVDNNFHVPWLVQEED